MTPEQEKMLKEAHEACLAIKQLLKGYNGDKGLCENFEDHKKDDTEFRGEFYRFKTQVYVLMAFAAGGGGFIGSVLSKWLNI